MLISALFLASSPVLDRQRCVAAHHILEQRVAEFHWIVTREERRQRLSEEEARRIRLDATIAVRPYLNHIRDIAGFSTGGKCEQISREGMRDFVERVVEPYREMIYGERNAAG